MEIQGSTATFCSDFVSLLGYWLDTYFLAQEKDLYRASILACFDYRFPLSRYLFSHLSNRSVFLHYAFDCLIRIPYGDFNIYVNYASLNEWNSFGFLFG